MDYHFKIILLTLFHDCSQNLAFRKKNTSLNQPMIKTRVTKDVCKGKPCPRKTGTNNREIKAIGIC